MKLLITAVCALFIAAAGRTAAAPAAPMFVPTLCPPGSPIRSSWTVYEDRNGDGYYDHATALSQTGRIVDGLVGNVGTAIGQLSTETGAATSTFTAVVLADGRYTWKVEIVGVSGAAVCRVETTGAGSEMLTSCTCSAQPQGVEEGSIRMR